MAPDISPASLQAPKAAVGEKAAPEVQVRKPTERLLSLDAFRGFTMFWIVGGGALMVGFQHLGHNMAINLIVHELTHTPWIGLRFYDCIWPCFMLMVGVSIPLSLAKRSLTESYNQQLRHAIERAVVIFLLGSVRESIALNSPFLIELSSALQPIAIAYIVAFLVARKSWRFQAGLAAIILAAYACVLAFVPAPGIPAGTYVLNHNLVHWIDIKLLGQHHWNIWPYRDEGWGTVISTIPTISTTLFGLLIGELLLSARSKATKAKVIGGMGVLFLVIGFGLSPVIPIEMKMWTTSYGLASAGVACLEFLFFFWLVDMARYRKWCVIFTPFGMNAIFIYMATSLISFRAGTDVFAHPIAMHLGHGELLFEAIVTLGVEWVILFWMMKRRILIKA
jgi:predicted acyltransferase